MNQTWNDAKLTRNHQGRAKLRCRFARLQFDEIASPYPGREHDVFLPQPQCLSALSQKPAKGPRLFFAKRVHSDLYVPDREHSVAIRP